MQRDLYWVASDCLRYNLGKQFGQIEFFGPWNRRSAFQLFDRLENPLQVFYMFSGPRMLIVRDFTRGG